MSEFVLDASAILALIFREPGAGDVERALPDAMMSTVNLTEVVARLCDRGMPIVQVEQVMAGLPLTLVPFTRSIALAAGFLRREIKPFGLSLGDRACLATARTAGRPALTADSAWQRLKLTGVEVQVIR
ncbi:MAG: PIN domain-containing protein [Alphaproteobacteria bacterium]|nr:PIN domain-containing protein [Alphaproteobacteria bacterium]